jgi:excisionase family DNA binding protein
MLGFSGHFSTKSRTYSTTIGALRADRAAYQREQAIAGLLPNLNDDTVLVCAQWHFAGRARAARGPVDSHHARRAVPAADGRCAMPRLLLTVPEAAEALAISRSKLYELIAGGLIRSVRIDGSRRVPVEALQTYVAHLLDQEEAIHAKAS